MKIKTLARTFDKNAGRLLVYLSLAFSLVVSSNASACITIGITTVGCIWKSPIGVSIGAESLILRPSNTGFYLMRVDSTHVKSSFFGQTTGIDHQRILGTRRAPDTSLGAVHIHLLSDRLAGLALHKFWHVLARHHAQLRQRGTWQDGCGRYVDR